MIDSKREFLRTRRILLQRPQDKNKRYALHAPEALERAAILSDGKLDRKRPWVLYLR